MSYNSGFSGGRGFGGGPRGGGGRGGGLPGLSSREGLNTGTNASTNTGTNTGGIGCLTISGSNREISQLLQHNHRDISQMLDRLPGHFNVSFTSQSSTLVTGQSNPPALKGNKRSLPDEGPEPKKQKKAPKEPDVINPNVCGNCGAANHKAAFCVKIGRSGWMEACPKCDSKQHLYESCPQRNKGSEDFTYLITNRQRKPPVKSRMKLGEVIMTESSRENSPWHPSMVIDLPYSSKYARQEARLNPPELYTYAHVGNPTDEAKGRTPEPSRTDVIIANTFKHNSVGQQSWSQKEEEFDPAQDSPMPIHIKLEDPHRYLTGRYGYETPRPSRPTPMRSCSVSSRAASIASIRSVILPPVPCINCGQLGHVIDRCPGKCAACGEHGHSVHDCELSDDICVCQAIPCHLLKDCGQRCRYCTYFSDNDEPHFARDCPFICHYCLVKGHTMADCAKAIPEKTECALCLLKGDGVKYHLPSQCIWNWCPDEQCNSRLGCVNHCKGCGWDRNQIDILLVGREDTHKCRFHKFWAGKDDLGRPGIGLQCVHDKEHQFEHSELLAVREIVVKEMLDALPVEGLVQKWPVECPTCCRNEENTPNGLERPWVEDHE